MKNIISFLFISLFLCLPAKADEIKVINVVETVDFIEIWSFEGNKDDAEVNFIREARTYLEITQNGEKIAMSIELAQTVTEIRFEIKSFRELDDREILEAIVGESSPTTDDEVKDSRVEY